MTREGTREEELGGRPTGGSARRGAGDRRGGVTDRHDRDGRAGVGNRLRGASAETRPGIYGRRPRGGTHPWADSGHYVRDDAAAPEAGESSSRLRGSAAEDTRASRRGIERCNLRGALE
jgi:hypothetical protein